MTYSSPSPAAGRGLDDAMNGTALRHALTIDVEEWFHDDWRPERGADWDHLPSTVAADVATLLALLDGAGARATFFVLGDVARRRPAMIRRIAAAGHEIASHGFAHRAVATQTPAELRRDLRDSLAALADCVGALPRGYRAPYFLRSARDLWAVEVLAEVGLRYDASYLPLRWMPYLGRDTPRAPYRHPCGVWEFPLPVAEAFGGWNLPYAGGGAMLRFLPYRTIRRFMLAHQSTVGPAVVYAHPWELDPVVRALPGTPRHVRLWKRIGRGGMRAKLARLLGEFRFAPIREVYAAQLGA